MNYLALTLPGGSSVNPPSDIPRGGLSYLTGALQQAITLMIILGIVLILIYIVWAGAQWISSGGDKAKLAAARAKLTWAIIGFIVVLLSVFILNVIGFLFKVNLLKLG